MSNKCNHDEKVKQIGIKPSIIGLDHIVLATGEATIFTNDGRVFGQPDNLLFDPSTQTLYQVEYKCTDSKPDGARMQLRRNAVVLESIFPYMRVCNLYIHDDFMKEVVR